MGAPEGFSVFYCYFWEAALRYLTGVATEVWSNRIILRFLFPCFYYHAVNARHPVRNYHSTHQARWWHPLLSPPHPLPRL